MPPAPPREVDVSDAEPRVMEALADLCAGSRAGVFKRRFWGLVSASKNPVPGGRGAAIGGGAAGHGGALGLIRAI
jgi:hypothetical protein